MAAFVLVNASVVINSVDLSDHVRSVTIDYSAETPESTAMGAGTTKQRLPGLLDWKIDVEFNQDYATGKVHATLWPLMGTLTTIIVQAVAGAESATNPKFTGTGIINKYNPLSGKVGDVNTTKVEIVAGSTPLTLDITP